MKKILIIIAVLILLVLVVGLSDITDALDSWGSVNSGTDDDTTDDSTEQAWHPSDEESCFEFSPKIVTTGQDDTAFTCEIFDGGFTVANSAGAFSAGKLGDLNYRSGFMYYGYWSTERNGVYYSLSDTYGFKVPCPTEYYPNVTVGNWGDGFCLTIAGADYAMLEPLQGDPDHPIQDGTYYLWFIEVPFEDVATFQASPARYIICVNCNGFYTIKDGVGRCSCGVRYDICDTCGYNAKYDDACLYCNKYGLSGDDSPVNLISVVCDVCGSTHNFSQDKTWNEDLCVGFDFCELCQYYAVSDEAPCTVCGGDGVIDSDSSSSEGDNAEIPKEVRCTFCGYDMYAEIMDGGNSCASCETPYDQCEFCDYYAVSVDEWICAFCEREAHFYHFMDPNGLCCWSTYTHEYDASDVCYSCSAVLYWIIGEWPDEPGYHEILCPKCDVTIYLTEGGYVTDYPPDEN